MDAAHLAEFADLLHQRRTELGDQIRAADAELGALTAARGDSTSDDEHDPEGSTLSGDWSRITGLRTAAITQTAAVDRAMERLDRGGYGLCVRCGRDIPIERLRARPAAETCVRCASV